MKAESGKIELMKTTFAAVWKVLDAPWTCTSFVFSSQIVTELNKWDVLLVSK